MVSGLSFGIDRVFDLCYSKCILTEKEIAMPGIMKKTVKYGLVFAAALCSCVLLLLLVCTIPQSAIAENSRASASYLAGEEAFPLLVGRLLNTRGDNYADGNLLNVIYNIDTEHPFSSLVEASYYRVDGESAVENYYQTVFEGQQPNAEYARYWHGSQVLVRPLLTVMSVRGIRFTLFGLLVVLNLWLVIYLLRKKQGYAAILYVAGLVLTDFWMTAFSLEYIMTFLNMTAVSLAVCYRYLGHRSDADMTDLFIVSGVVTCFLDFLTTETLAFTVPFLLLLFLRKSQNSLGTFRQEFLCMVRYGGAWLLSYGLTFAVKWGSILVTMGKTAFENALQSAAARVDGSIYAGEIGSFGSQLSGALLRNLACLFPVTSDVSTATVILLVCGTLAVLGAVFYLFRKDPVDGSFIGLLSLVALIPYMRLLCLSNHSYIHYFFTYRAQMSAIMALLGIVLYSVRPAASPDGARKWKKKPKVR